MIKVNQLIWYWIIILFLSFSPALTSIFAQRGGKAEPLNIKFKRNSTSATFKDVIRGSEEAEYQFEAREGQKLNIKINSTPKASVSPQIKDSDLENLKLEQDGSSSWVATLPKSGEYFMSVMRDRKGTGRSTYILTISIK